MSFTVSLNDKQYTIEQVVYEWLRTKEYRELYALFLNECYDSDEEFVIYSEHIYDDSFICVAKEIAHSGNLAKIAYRNRYAIREYLKNNYYAKHKWLQFRDWLQDGEIDRFHVKTYKSIGEYILFNISYQFIHWVNCYELDTKIY